MSFFGLATERGRSDDETGAMDEVQSPMELKLDDCEYARLL